MTSTYVVVSTHNRHREIHQLIDSIGDSAKKVFVCDNASATEVKIWRHNVIVWRDETQPVNLSEIWNQGLDLAAYWASAYGETEYNVAILNDDVILPPGWLEGVGSAMRESGAALASGCQFPLSYPILYTKQEPTPCELRPAGFARVLRGELDLRFNEELKYWYSDDELDWESRVRGGSLVLPGFEVEHTNENGWHDVRPELQRQSLQDRLTFEKKWGQLPC